MKLYSIGISFLLLAFFAFAGIETPNTQLNNLPKIESINSSILFVGDIMLDRSVKQKINANNFDYLLEGITNKEPDFFTQYDTVHGNLEGAVADFRRPTSKSIAFNFDADDVEQLKKYNFSLFTLANNHSYDMGNTAFGETKATLKELDFNFYGQQYYINENSLLIKEINNRKIAFIGINDTNSPADESEIIELINDAKEQAEFIILNIHWGPEYKLKSFPRQKQLAHKLIDSGIDMIIGHHPHVIQEVEIYKNKPIFYSLGNFLFDQYFSENTQQGLGVAMTLTDKKLNLQLHMFESSKSALHLMDKTKALELFKRIQPIELKKEFIDIENFRFELSR